MKRCFTNVICTSGGRTEYDYLFIHAVPIVRRSPISMHYKKNQGKGKIFLSIKGISECTEIKFSLCNRTLFFIDLHLKNKGFGESRFEVENIFTSIY